MNVFSKVALYRRENGLVAAAREFYRLQELTEEELQRLPRFEIAKYQRQLVPKKLAETLTGAEKEALHEGAGVLEAIVLETGSNGTRRQHGFYAVVPKERAPQQKERFSLWVERRNGHAVHVPIAVPLNTEHYALPHQKMLRTLTEWTHAYLLK